MATHNESDNQKNPDSGNSTKQTKQQEDGLDSRAAGRGAKNNPDGLPDGSGTNTPGAGSDQGQEDGGKSFDAG